MASLARLRGGRVSMSFRFLVLAFLCSRYTTVFGAESVATVLYEAGYTDLSGNCPAITTCPMVCAQNLTSCPLEMQACGNGLTLCDDGSCAETCDEELYNPCEYECAPVACAMVVNYYDYCLEAYNSSYAYVDECVEEEIEETTTLLTFKEWPFLLCYYWVAIATLYLLTWCFFNQRILKIENSTKSIPFLNDNEEETLFMTQIAYKSNAFGSVGAFLVILTQWAIHGVILIVILLYYQQQEQVLMNFNTVFEDEEQCLEAYILAWTVGIVWSLALKWPYSITSLFLRRCRFVDATSVCVHTPKTNKTEVSGINSNSVVRMKAFLTCIGRGINVFSALIFSDDIRWRQETGDIEFCKIYYDSVSSEKYFYYRFRRYIYNAESDGFTQGEWIVAKSTDELCNKNHLIGLSPAEVEERLHIIGPNVIRLRKPSLLRSTREVFSGAFYVYQTFLIWSWFPLWYYYMAFLWAFIIIVSALTLAFSNYRGEVSLYQLAQMEGNVEVIRREVGVVSISHKDLVPGDLVVLKPGMTYCDMVVLKHTKLVLDESALTGESAPVSKVSIDPKQEKKGTLYDINIHKQCTILAGTTILETSGTDNDLGLVTKTSSFTSKGEMLRDILSFERHHFKFDTEVKVVLVILFVWAVVAFIITWNLIEDTWVYGFFYGIYVFATALPPLLPTVFVVSVGISQRRLRRKSVTCTNNESILVAGKVSKALFDKTGTLTKQGLSFIGIRSNKSFDMQSSVTSEYSTTASGDLVVGMACCHTLSQTSSGDLVGNTVDKMMFTAVNASLDLGEKNKWTIKLGTATLEVLKRFEFDHHRMTQSVIVKNQDDGNVYVYVKGSAESIEGRCDPNTLPEKFTDIVRQCAKEGIYQISIASKELITKDANSLTREEVESNLSFSGSVDFKNTLRDETSNVIKELKDGAVTPIMVTGDNALTGIHIAKECGMIDGGKGKQVILAQEVHADGKIVWVDEHEEPIEIDVSLTIDSTKHDLAMLGSAWKSLYKNHRAKALQLVDRVTVFGRCTPQDKVTVVTALNEKGYITSMCGDGGNDCGALKTAHVGIALSDAEASIVAPFTSLDKSISSVLYVLLEGRCALANSFASYKYLMMYGMVTTVNQMVNAYYQITFGEWCWIFSDGIWMLSLTFTIPYSKAREKLSPERPTASLLGLHTMFSFVGVLVINVLFLFIGLAVMHSQDFYKCRKWTEKDVGSAITIGDNYESSVIFVITGYQYISAAITYNFGYNFRASWQKNYVLVFLVLVFTIIHLVSTVGSNVLSCLFRLNCLNDDIPWTFMVKVLAEDEPYPINNPYNTTYMPIQFRWTLVGIVVANTIIIIAYEYFIANGVIQRMASQRKIDKWSRQETKFLGNAERVEEYAAMEKA